MSAGRYAWMASALCAQADPDEWTEVTQGSRGATARRICGSCPVQADCEAHAQALHQFDGSAPAGVWGGAGRRKRHRERQQLGEAA